VGKKPRLFGEVRDALNWFVFEAAIRYTKGRRLFGTAAVLRHPLHNAQDLFEELIDATFYLRQTVRNLEPDRGRMRVFVSGPYTTDDPEERERFMAEAKEAVAILAKMGHYPICPHLHWNDWENHPSGLSYFYFVRWCLDQLKVSHALCRNPGSEGSRGAKIEYHRAKLLGLPIYYGPESVPSPKEVLRAGWTNLKSG